jgi:hypothetical protein
MVLVLMAQERPPLLAGYLNWTSVYQYFTGTAGAVIGTGSIIDFPYRLAMATSMLVISLGVCLVPLSFAFRRPMSRPATLMTTSVVFALWFHLTSLDPVSWTFMCFGLPFMVVLGMQGLTRLTPRHVKMVAVCAVALIVVNSALLNADHVAKMRPEAVTYYETVRELPEDSAVLVYQGRYSLGLYYAMAEGREDLAPIIACTAEGGDTWSDYLGWMQEEYGITGNTTVAMVESAYSSGRNTYIVGDSWFYDSISDNMWERLNGHFNLASDGAGRDWLHEVAGSTGSSYRR